jgi:hypothetical protein
MKFGILQAEDPSNLIPPKTRSVAQTQQELQRRKDRLIFNSLTVAQNILCSEYKLQKMFIVQNWP